MNTIIQRNCFIPEINDDIAKALNRRIIEEITGKDTVMIACLKLHLQKAEQVIHKYEELLLSRGYVFEETVKKGKSKND